MSTIVAPSLLSCDFGRIKEESERLNASDADWFHLDVMDGIFVPNISFGLPIIQAFAKHAKKPCDVHAMIARPDDYIEAFKDHGADHLSIHFEACTHLHRTLEAIQKTGMKSGVALNPHTPASVLRDVLDLVDIVIIMSVNPGFGGQKFIPHSIQKVAELRSMIDSRKTNTVIEVDGGVTVENASSLVAAGATALVAGSTVYGSNDPEATIKALKNA